MGNGALSGCRLGKTNVNPTLCVYTGRETPLLGHSSCCDLLWEQPLLLPGMGFHRRQLTLQLIVWEDRQQNGFLVKKNALSAKSDLWLKSSGPSWSFSIVILDLGPV